MKSFSALILAAATLLSFDRLWTRFHLVAFSNDLWMLDPARDRLIQLFPPEFWLDATLLLAGMTLLEAILIRARAPRPEKLSPLPAS